MTTKLIKRTIVTETYEDTKTPYIEEDLDAEDDDGEDEEEVEVEEHPVARRKR